MGKTVKLTPKQEKFCQCIVSGMDGKSSYIAAYDTKASDQTIYTESLKLLKRDDITARIKELRIPIENHQQNIAINERQQQIDFIKERIQICKDKEDEQSIIRYTDMLNKIYSCYKDNEQEEKQENTVSQLDAATLKKLSGIA
jgi:hypothetical protein